MSLVVAWFGDDLRAGAARIRPGVELAAKTTAPKTWSVNRVARANAHLVSRNDEDRPVFGGAPADFAVVQAIREMRARGLRVTFYPFILMDVPSGNTLPNPYSDNAAGIGQPAFPWRGRITVAPAAGFAGTVDKRATAAAQVSALFGQAAVGDFAVAGEAVNYTGPADDWGLRRMVLHYVPLCAAAGGVRLAQGRVERLMDAIERAVVAPQVEIRPHRAARREVLRKMAPLAAGLEQAGRVAKVVEI